MEYRMWVSERQVGKMIEGKGEDVEYEVAIDIPEAKG